ncbi:TrbI/VirB10 family protein [Emcibacter nanhaiensis]|uniref:TrbI/VirB10 family protein n=1 Tax=Emcibacter nanhaiensis TaxID=1505037 RepID=A0A501PIA9_9PROT|nr:TrbI/VirB10 family protein [Emcibacter nanhaiensis]TPD60223.1 hypothetical protein FIV46_09225 [Emcibacter nanhaiensis]
MKHDQNPLPPSDENSPEDFESGVINAMPQIGRGGTSSDRLVMIVAVVGALFLGLYTFSLMDRNRQEKALPVVAKETIEPADVPLPKLDETTEPEPVPEPVNKQVAPPPKRNMDRARAPTLVYDISGGSVHQVSAQPAAKGPGPSPAGGEKMTAEEQFALRLSSQNHKVVRASRTAARLDSLVPQGTIIKGVLETAINSDLPGYVRAMVSEEVRGFDGSRVLIPRGSRLIGQYRSGLAVGQTRAFILWTRLLTPDGISINLGSPAADGTGQSGLGGDVNTHFFKRFGSAILMSIVGGFSAALGGDDADVVVGVSQNAQSAASIALQQNIQIPPTITIDQGESIRVITARDVDFSAIDAEGAP